MLGIGHRLEKASKIKVLSEKAKEYNLKFDQLVQQGLQPDEAANTLAQQQFNRRHQQPPEKQPYNNSLYINPLGGTTNLGYMQTHKTLTQTQSLYARMDKQLKQTKQRGFSQTKKTPFEIEQFKKMRERVDKDHLADLVSIDLGEKINSNYKRDFVDDKKMNEIRGNRQLKYNARKNQLIWYAQTYIKTKDSLRKC